MTGVVRVAFEDGEGAVDLLEKNDAGKFVGESHFAEGKHSAGGFASLIAEAIGGTDGEDDRLGVPVLVGLEEVREFFGGELFSARIEQDERVGGAVAGFFAELEERGLVG